MDFIRGKIWSLIGPKNIKSVTLVELLFSVMMIGMLIVCFYGFETFSNNQVLDSDRRAKVQNELAYCLEHMSKYVQQANGNKVDKPIKPYTNGFQVNFDCKGTPSNLADDVWVTYFLSGHDLQVGCSGASCGSGGLCNVVPTLPATEVLSSKIMDNFSSGALPVPLVNGFTVNIDSKGNFVEIGLVGSYDPTKPVSGTRFVNPQVEMKTQVICNSSSTD